MRDIDILYYVDSKGHTRALTEGEWEVTKVVGVDSKEHWVYFVGTKDSPLERHLV